MTDKFKETVAKLAESPVKVAFIKMAKTPKDVQKALTFGERIFGGSDRTGWQEVKKHIASTVGAGAIIGSGVLLADELFERVKGNPDVLKAQHTELGRAQAQQRIKAQSVLQLQNQHQMVHRKMMQDEIISRADKNMINSAYDTMKRFAPNLAADENMARSFLREHALHGMGPSYSSLKNLAEAEQAVLRAGGAIG